MSNIPDITSLSDLLATSPSQPPTHQKPISTLQLGLATTKALSDINELQLDQENIHHGELKKELSEINSNVNGSLRESETGRSNEQETTGEEAIPGKDADNQEKELTELLNLRSLKLELSEERNKLLKKRSSLKSAIEDMKIRIAAYYNKKADESTKRRLQELLDNNTDEFIQSGNSSGASEQELVLKNLNVLPSQDWEHRLSLVKKFLSAIEIDKVKTFNEFNKQNELERKMEYTIIAPLLFKLTIKIGVKSSDDLITSIGIDNKSMIPISDISPSFYSILTSNYIKGKKIDLIMYGLNSLSSLTYSRVSLFHKLIRQFEKYVDKNKFQELIAPQELNNRIKLFAILKSVDRIELSVTCNDKAFKLCLIWEIVLSQVAMADCESNIKLLVYNENSDLGDISSLFLKLLKDGGVINALTIIFKRCFDIEVS